MDMQEYIESILNHPSPYAFALLVGYGVYLWLDSIESITITRIPKKRRKKR